MQMRYGFGRFGVVVGITCVVLLASTGLVTAQRRSSDRTLRFAPQDFAGGSRIGLSIEDVADYDAAGEGAVVRDVRPESPAASAGFTAGDVIVEFDGERVRSASQLTRLVQETPAGRTVGATVVRDDRRVELDVTPESGAAVMALPALEQLGDYTSRLAPDAMRDFIYDFWTTRESARLGVSVQELSPQLADYFGVDDGVLISSVDDESVASEAGLQAGDVVTSVDGRAVEDIAKLRRRLSAVDPGEEVSIGVRRAGSDLELTATINEDRARQRRLEIFRNNGQAL